MSSKKKALLVGINYKGTSSALQGCINDVHAIKAYLTSKGYAGADIEILTDESVTQPTRRNILKSLLDLILSDAKELFFHYSGHGSYITDTSGDEKDGKDESLVPIDYAKSGYIIDDELRGILECLKRDQTLVILLDCCHSGTGVDLAYELYERYGGGGKLQLLKNNQYKETRGRCVMISGCKDSQTSADAYIKKKFQGAFTNAFIEAVNSSKMVTYEALIKKIREILKRGNYQQIPILTSGKKLDLNAVFEI